MQATVQAVSETKPLAEIERVLDFVPCANTAPKKLTPDQIGRFNRDGGLAPLDVFSSSEMEHHRANFDRMLEIAQREGKDSYSVNGWHTRYAELYDLVTEPRVLAYVRDLIGEDFLCWGSHYFCKLPGDTKAVSWHQDAVYWPFSHSRTVTVWLAIDDADPENGCMQVLPGSHRHGPMKHGQSGEAEKNVLWLTAQGVDRFGKPVDTVLKAGQIGIHSDMLLHSSPPNPSARRRCGLTMRYCPPSVKPYNGWGGRGILCSGEDRYGYWKYPPRPQE
ncbi:MAG: phytanoyl-CoA dioxygenase family protein [Planctomycetes bacterium]|nr:phytanoyl-CoA dioxygenase family protein [Planctomycetota bacterium]